MRCTECSKELKPVVAIDIDGTLAEYHEHLLRFFERYFNKTMPREWNGTGDWEDFLGLTRREYQDAKLAFRQGGFKRWMPMVRQADIFVQSCFRDGAEVWITTTRPYMRLDSVDPDTREWLSRNKIPYHHLLYDEEKYEVLGSIVGNERVVAVLDDLPDQIIKACVVFGNNIPVVIARPHNCFWRLGHDLSTETTVVHAPRVVNSLYWAQKVILERINEFRRQHT